MLWKGVGSPNAFAQSASGGSLALAWSGTQPRTAGDLLVIQVGVTGSATLPAAPSGWSIAKQQAGTSCSASLFYKTAAGGDAAPTIAAITGAVISAQLVEYTGPSATNPVDQTGGAASAASPFTATAGAKDAFGDDLFLVVMAMFYSAAATKSSSMSSNQPIFLADNNDAVSSAHHYLVAGFTPTTPLSVADTVTATPTATNLTGAAVAFATFKAQPNGPMPRPSLAVQQSAVR